ncbi:hypothetical protein LSTR_LSTR003674 [Laodelphax striatellus]|uniref:Condensin complex subunit 2 n=1 Tax=Laodelphax striatellus TaxID=195883 RepID=A0A482XBF6_LAOST|nr:hypothetical protein LSTR_LSTR003674 [Laodelphax striatellus]
MLDCERGSISYASTSSAGSSREYNVLGKRKSPKLSINKDETSSRMSHPAFSRHRTAQRDDELHSNTKRQRSESSKRSIVNEDQLLQAVNVVMDDDDDDVFPSAQFLIQSRISDNEKNESRMQFGCRIAAHCLGSNLSNEYLSSYLATCIQLNTANKINKNNAFSLQLIDYMCVLIERNDETINDFPTMSCSLDASSRIYACRVDCVHSGVMEIATGLASVTEKAKRNKTNNEMESSGEHSEGDDVISVEKRTKKRKRKNVISSLEGICRKSIEMGHWTQRPAIKPDFTSLLSYASVTQSENSCLSLMQDHVPLIPERKTKQLAFENRFHTISFDLPKGTNLLSSELEEEEDALSGDECNNNNYTHLSMNDIRSVEPDENVQDAVSNQHEEVVDGLENIPVFEEPVDHQVLQNAVLSDDDDDDNGDERDKLEEIFQTGCKRKRKASREDASNFVNDRALHAAEESIYSYFDTDLLPDLWAGPDYWKPRFRRHKPARVVEVAPEKPNKKAPKNDLLSFEDLSDDDVELDKNKAEGKVEKRLMAKWSDSGLIKPLKKNYKIEDLFCSFLRKTLFFKPYLKKEDDKDEVKVELEYADDGQALFGGLFEENIRAMSENESAQDGNEPPLSPEANDSELDTEEQTLFGTVFNKDNRLPSRPVTDQHNTLTYATVPKKLDMKMLKNGVWKLLDFDGNEKEHSVVEKSCIANSRGELLFSNIYKNLPNYLPDAMWKDTSPALVFLALLHLANEKTLKLKPFNSSMTDILIEKD